MPSMSTSVGSPTSCPGCTAARLASEQEEKAVTLKLCQEPEEAKQVQNFAVWVQAWMSEGGW